MRIPKRYGQSRIDSCPFCSKTAVTKNGQGVPVCVSHKNENLTGLKCACGSYLDVKTGKWGAYFSCFRCGNINIGKALEMNPAPKTVKKEEVQKPKERKEVVIRSDELHLYY